MTLTFRSTVTELVQLLIRDADGSQRVARLERDPSNPRKWAGSISHPSGETWPVAAFSHDAVDALGKIATAFASRESDFKASKGRGHKPEPTMRDRSVRVDDVGNTVGAPIYGSINIRR